MRNHTCYYRIFLTVVKAILYKHRTSHKHEALQLSLVCPIMSPQKWGSTQHSRSGPDLHSKSFSASTDKNFASRATTIHKRSSQVQQVAKTRITVKREVQSPSSYKPSSSQPSSKHGKVRTTRRPKAPTLPEDTWNSVKLQIRQYYLKERKTCAETVALMSKHYQFHST